MSGPFFYVVDEGPNRHYPTLEEAKADAEIQIDQFRDACDPEWSPDVEIVSVWKCDAETDEPTEDGVCVLQATEVDRREPEEGDEGVDYWCDFAMLAPDL